MTANICRLLDLAAAATPRALAATLEDDRATFGDIARASARLAHALIDWGVRPGDRLVYWADISLRAIDLFFAASRVGAVVVPINPGFSAAELGSALEYVRPAFVVVDAARQDEGDAAARRVDARLGVLDASVGGVAGLDLETAMAAADERAPRAMPDSAAANVMFLTSGSTGRPKAVVISHRANWQRAAVAPSYDGVCGGGGTASMFPLYHMAGWHMIHQAFGRRRAVHLTRHASAEALWAIIERHRPNELYCIPGVWRRLLETAAARDGSSLKLVVTGTSRVEPDLIDELRRRFPRARLAVTYGSTEMGVSLGICDEDIARKPYSVGLPMPNVEARLIDGELCLRSDTAMDGYFELPRETAEAVRDGWYRSGDLAEQDDEGFYMIVGRRREIIRSGGESIAPAEVEAAIAAMPGVTEVAVVGVPDPSWGEIVCAVIVADRQGQSPPLEAVRAHLAGSLASFKHPRMLRVRRDPLPRTGATGQIQRSLVRQELLAEQASADG